VWCNVVSWLLGLKSYLLGTETPANDDDAAPRQPADDPGLAGGGLGAAHQALLLRDIPVGFQPYERPSVFALRLLGLILLMCVSLVIGSLIALTVPVWIGRYGMTIWSMGSHIPQPQNLDEAAQSRPHELYTAAMGEWLDILIFSRLTPFSSGQAFIYVGFCCAASRWRSTSSHKVGPWFSIKFASGFPSEVSRILSKANKY
jgi:E3 ubiquitin-protein ligase MARCH6